MTPGQESWRKAMRVAHFSAHVNLRRYSVRAIEYSGVKGKRMWLYGVHVVMATGTERKRG